MANKPSKPGKEFGSRKPSVPNVSRPPGPPAKRSGHVALFLMGTLAVGGSAYALMPRNKCEQPPNVAQPSLLQNNPDCSPRGSSSSSHGGSGGGGSSSHSSYYSSDSSSSHSGSGTSDSGSHSAQRGGFGSFGHAVGFSGG
ncbi:MAG: hypothetical protein ACREEK_28420 [Bradyrhizobium sp.]